MMDEPLSFKLREYRGKKEEEHFVFTKAHPLNGFCCSNLGFYVLKHFMFLTIQNVGHVDTS